MAYEEPVAGESPIESGESLAVELAGDLGDSLREYVKELFTAFDAALAGNYDAKRLVEDASRMTSRAIRDTAKLILSGFALATAAADRTGEGTPPTGTPGTTEPPATTEPPGATPPASTPY
jgi:hypothetical protein